MRALSFGSQVFPDASVSVEGCRPVDWVFLADTDTTETADGEIQHSPLQRRVGQCGSVHGSRVPSRVHSRIR